MGKRWCSVNTRIGVPGSKSPRNVKKFQKLKFTLDNYAEYDEVRSQTAQETNQRRSKLGLKQSRDRTRSMRRKIQTRGFDLRLSP
jgi:hypothetical protein